MPQVKELCEKSAKAGLGDGAETRRRGLTHDPSFPKGQLEKPIRHVPKSEPYFILRQLEPDALRWCGKTGGGLLICAWLGYFFD